MIDAFASLRSAHGPVATWALLALAFLLPLTPALLPVLLVLAMAALIVHHRLWRKNASSSPWDRPMWSCAALYLLYVIGLCWTTDFDYGLFDLQIKLPLLVLPLVLVRMPLDQRTGGAMLLQAFVAGNVLAVLLCCVMVPVHVFTGNGGMATEVFGNEFSLFLHPSYFALYLALALAAFLLLPPVAGLGPWSRMAIVDVLVLGIVLCGSKMGWSGLPVVLIGVLAARWGDRPLRRLVLGLIVLSAVGAGTLILASSGVRDRVLEAWHAVASPEKHQDAATSSEARKLAWDGARDVIARHLPWGTGTGDVKNELIATYTDKGYVHLVEKRLNAHSQFLQTMATLGWPGIGLLVALLTALFAAALRTRDALGVLFVLLCVLNWAVESMLEVQAGVVLFAFIAWSLAARPSRTSPAT